MKIILIPFQIETAGQLNDIEKLTETRIKQTVSDPEEEIEIVFPELSLAGPDAADGFFRINNAQIDQQLIKLKKVSKQYPNASIYIGFPYTIDGKRHICHGVIKNGKIKLVSGKRELANNIGGVINFDDPSKSTSSARGGVEYETRYFEPTSPGVHQVTMAKQKGVNFGAYNDTPDDKKLLNNNSALIVCEEMFIGVEKNGNMEENPIVKLAKKGEAKRFIIINASPNANYKMPNRVKALKKITDYLQQQGIHDVSLHYVNNYGTHSAVNFFDGASHHIYFDKDQYVTRSQAHTDKAFTFDTHHPEATLNEGDFFLQNNSKQHDEWDIRDETGSQLPYRHELENVQPLIFADVEYAYQALKKYSKKYKGYFVSLSGGFDSAFTITTLALALDIKLRRYHKELGSLPAAIAKVCADLNITEPSYGEFYQQLNHAQNLDEAAALLKKNLIKAAYIKTENNSLETEHAARTIAEELGAGFEVVQIDSMYMGILLSYMFPKTYEALPENDQRTLLAAYESLLNSKDQDYQKNMQAFKDCATKFGLGEPHIIIHWKQKNAVDLENVQARTRAWLNWIISVVNHLKPTSNPNFNETVNSYTTVCGDRDAGDFSLTAHRQKAHIQAILAHVQKFGIPENPVMTGAIKPVNNIKNLWAVKPSAELQKLDDDGKTKQTDEGAYGLSYHQLFILAQYMFGPSSNPKENASFINIHELLIELRKHPLFSNVPELGVLKMLRDVHTRFLFSRFKRRAMPISQVSENSIEPHANLRFPLIGAMEYVYADLNLAFLRLTYPQWVSENEDKIVLALLTHKPFADAVTQHRNNALDKRQEMTAGEFEALNTLLNTKAKIKPIASEVAHANFMMIANTNPTALNFADNIKQIKQHIDEACKKGVKLLVFPESSLTGHDLDDGIRYVRNQQIELLLNDIAAYAKARNPELTVAVGHPWLPNNSVEKDRSQRFVSAMSILGDGEIKKVILRKEPLQAEDHNTPNYATRQMRALNHYHQEGNISTFNQYAISYNGGYVDVAFCFDTPTAATQGTVTVQVGGKKATEIPNSVFVNQRGAPAASTCQDGRIVFKSQYGRSEVLTDPYSLQDLNYATFALHPDKELYSVNGKVMQETSKAALMLKHDAMYAYVYMRSAPIAFTVSLTGDVDATYNITVVKSAIAQRFAGLRALSIDEKCKVVSAELGIKPAEGEVVPQFADENAAIIWLLNKKLVVIDVNKEPVALDPTLGVTPKHYPLNEKLLNAIIQKVSTQYGKGGMTSEELARVRNRYVAIISWMITASYNAIPIGNGTRTHLGLNQMVFGGDLHQGALSFSLHRSRSEIRNILGLQVATDDAKVDAYLDNFKKPLRNLKDDIKSLDDFNEMKRIYFLWFDGQLLRNAIPITPETEESVSRQTAYREIPYARPLKHELVELVLDMMFPKMAEEDKELLLTDVSNEAYQVICQRLLGEQDVKVAEWNETSTEVQNILMTRKVAQGQASVPPSQDLTQLIKDAIHKYQETPLQAYLRLRTLTYANHNRAFPLDSNLIAQIKSQAQGAVHQVHLQELDHFYAAQVQRFKEEQQEMYINNGKAFNFFNSNEHVRVEDVNTDALQKQHFNKNKQFFI